MSLNSKMNSVLSNLNVPLQKGLYEMLLVLFIGLQAGRYHIPGGNLAKIAILTILIWSRSKDFKMSLLWGLSFVLVVNMLSGRRLFEAFGIEQNTDVIPNCLGIKLENILVSFGGDRQRLTDALHNAGFSWNIELNDENAPRIATALINAGYNIDGLCGPY